MPEKCILVAFGTGVPARNVTVKIEQEKEILKHLDIYQKNKNFEKYFFGSTQYFETRL